MNNNRTLINALKSIIVLILDSFTFILVFSIWAILNLHLFPTAFTAILISLILVNVSIFASKKIITQFGVPAYASTLITTILYFSFVMVFTGISYISISPKWYIITYFIISLLYIAVILGLYISGSNKSKDILQTKVEQSEVLNTKLQLITLDENIKSCRDTVGKYNYDAIVAAYNDMSERLAASTPFGRTTKPVVIEFEKQISSKLSAINDDILSLKTSTEDESSGEVIIKALTDTKISIINREKLLVQ